jgi:hypothetical protein
MVSSRLKSAIVTSLVLSIAACTNTVPNNTYTNKADIYKNENFQDLDKEYVFSTEALTKSYLKRKLDKWLYENESANGPMLVKELAYGRYKHPTLICQIITDVPVILDDINAVDAISYRKSVDAPFSDFILGLEDCKTAVPPSSNSGEFQVNSTTVHIQENPDIAMDANGNFIVVWQSQVQATSNEYDIYAQLYNANGDRNGSEFQVNSFTTERQVNPTVAMDDSGDFVIAWQSFKQKHYTYSYPGYDDYEIYPNTYGVFSKRYNSVGDVQPPPGCGNAPFKYCDPLTGEFQVNTYITGDQADPSVAMDADGDFIITYTTGYDNIGFGNPDGSALAVFAQRFNADGSIPGTNGTEFLVNTTTDLEQRNPDVAMDDDGDFVITWQSTENSPGYYDNIYAQRYDSGGNRAGTEFMVNTFTDSYQRNAEVAMAGSGNFVIAWTSGHLLNNANQDGSYYGIYAQRYNADGTKPVTNGAEFLVNSTISGNQENVSTAMDDSGDFVITWQSEDQDEYAAGSFAGFGIFGQRYNSDGSKPATNGTEFLVNTYTTGEQYTPAVAMDNAGDFVVVWTSNLQPGQDNYYGVFGQRYNTNGTAQ